MEKTNPNGKALSSLISEKSKVVCVGLNYRSHAEHAGFPIPETPAIFCKFNNALAFWGVAEKDAMDCIWGYTCGNDLSCRDSQKRSGQWLIGKTMPGFAPVGPVVVPREDFDAFQPHFVRSYVNGEVRQNGNVSDLIFDCAKIVSYVSKYVRLEPGDLIFTGTPSGTAMEYKDEEHWLKPGDVVEIEIEGIGTLRNTMK